MLDRSIFRSRSIFGGRSIFPGRAKQTAFGTKLSVALFGAVAPGIRILDSAIGLELDRFFVLGAQGPTRTLSCIDTNNTITFTSLPVHSGSERILYSPAYNTVLCGTNTVKAHALDADTGAYLWEASTQSPVGGAPRGGAVDTVSGDFLIGVYGALSEIFRFDGAGAIVYRRWQSFTGPNCLATPSRGTGDYYVHGANNRLYRGRVSDGALVSSVLTPNRPISPIYYGGFAAGPFNVVYVDENKWIRCYSRDLNVLWAVQDTGIQVVNDIAIDKYGDVYLAGLRNSAPLLRRYDGMSGALVLDLEVESSQPHSRKLTSIHITDDGRVITTTDNDGASSPASEYRILVQS